ncbi:MAG: M6 family metalloprotease domain-containing protein [Bacteroidaceae bacterium]|jgi:M6 family metalloprotease-like protein
MRYFRLTSLLLPLLLHTVVGNAVPARRDTLIVRQPDGTNLTIVYQGDENGVFYTTLDGTPVEKSSDGFWRKSIVMSAAPARTTYMAAAPASYKVRDFPTEGNPRCLVVLVDFPDRKFTMDDELIRKKYWDLCNLKGYTNTVTYKGETFQGAIGSIKDYFEAQSYGVFSPSFDIIGPVHAAYGYAKYGKNTTSKPGTDTSNAMTLVKEICDSIISGNLADLTIYDNDRDGQVDMLGVIFAGNGENYSGSDPNTIWPHQYEIALQNIYGISYVNYFCTCELFWDSDSIIDGIGTFCHEFSHILGLPDFYDTASGSSNGMGYWSIMSYGSYGNKGFAPSGYTAFERYSLGWIDIPSADAPGSYTLEDLNDSGRALRLDTDDENKFILLENHQNEGWFKYQPASGLMVTSVSYKKERWLNNTVNAAAKNYTILPADNDDDVKSGSGDLFPYNGMDSITMNSTPALKVYDGSYITLPVTNIRNSDGKVTFRLGYGPDTPVRGLQESTVKSGMIQVFSISGKPAGEYSADMEIDELPLQPGIWLVRKNGVTTKVKR